MIAALIGVLVAAVLPSVAFAEDGQVKLALRVVVAVENTGNVRLKPLVSFALVVEAPAAAAAGEGAGSGLTEVIQAPGQGQVPLAVLGLARVVGSRARRPRHRHAHAHAAAPSPHIGLGTLVRSALGSVPASVTERPALA